MGLVRCVGAGWEWRGGLLRGERGSGGTGRGEGGGGELRSTGLGRLFRLKWKGVRKATGDTSCWRITS